MSCNWRKCPYSAHTLQDLYEHCVIAHGSEPTSICRWMNCHRLCYTKARLETHFLKHVPFRAFQCRACGSRFKRKQELSRHCTKKHTRINFDGDLGYTFKELEDKENVQYRKLEIADLVN